MTRDPEIKDMPFQGAMFQVDPKIIIFILIDAEDEFDTPPDPKSQRT